MPKRLPGPCFKTGEWPPFRQRSRIRRSRSCSRMDGPCVLSDTSISPLARSKKGYKEIQGRCRVSYLPSKDLAAATLTLTFAEAIWNQQQHKNLKEQRTPNPLQPKSFYNNWYNPILPRLPLVFIPSAQTVSRSFYSLFRVLFNFPSRYLFAIGLPEIFSLRR